MPKKIITFEVIKENNDLIEFTYMNNDYRYIKEIDDFLAIVRFEGSSTVYNITSSDTTKMLKELLIKKELI